MFAEFDGESICVYSGCVVSAISSFDEVLFEKGSGVAAVGVCTSSRCFKCHKHQVRKKNKSVGFEIDALNYGLQHLGSPGCIFRIWDGLEMTRNVIECLLRSRNLDCMGGNIIPDALQACAGDQFQTFNGSERKYIPY